MYLLTSCSKNLIHHVPIESVEHILAGRVLIAECWPELRPDAVVKWPGVFPYDQLRLPLPAGLQQRVHLGKSLQRLLLTGGRLRLDDNVAGVDMRRERVVDVGDVRRLLLDHRQRVR